MKVVLYFVNRTKGYLLDNVVEEIEAETSGELYRRCLGLFGRCASKVYVGDKEIGWVFERAEECEDTKEKFMKEAWVVPLERIEPEWRAPLGL